MYTQTHFHTSIFEVGKLPDDGLSGVHALVKETFNKDVIFCHYRYAIICRCNEAVVGCALMRHALHRLTLEKLCTRPGMRRQGIATSIISCAQGIGVDIMLHVDNTPGHDELVAYYSRRGFKVRNQKPAETCMIWNCAVAERRI